MLRTRRFGDEQQLHIHQAMVRKIFVTHMHVDHIMGIVPLMNSVMPGYRPPTEEVRLELYGPAGLRSFIRNNLRMCQIRLCGKYAVDELLTADDPVTPCSESELHPNEVPGRDIMADEKGLWRGILRSRSWPVSVDAGPLKHRVPCVGYAFTEDSPEPMAVVNYESRRRKVVICGDSSDASGMTEIAMYPSVLVHEATKAYMPAHVLNSNPRLAEKADELFALLKSSATSHIPGDQDKLEPAQAEVSIFSPTLVEGSSEEAARQVSSENPVHVREVAIASGHSTPAMAGEFALSIAAKELYLNHLSTQFHAHLNYKSSKIAEMERQAQSVLTNGKVIAAHDLLSVEIQRVLPGPHPPHTQLRDVLNALNHMLARTNR